MVGVGGRSQLLAFQGEGYGVVEMVLWIPSSQGQFSLKVPHLGSLNVFPLPSPRALSEWVPGDDPASVWYVPSPSTGPQPEASEQGQCA